MREFMVYSRRGCHLCDEMLEQLEPLCRGRGTLLVRDVDTSPEWTDAYGLHLPVLMVDGEEICRYQLDRSAVLQLLATQSN